MYFHGSPSRPIIGMTAAKILGVLRESGFFDTREQRSVPLVHGAVHALATACVEVAWVEPIF